MGRMFEFGPGSQTDEKLSSLTANLMEMQQSSRLQNDGRTENTRRPNEKRAQTGDESICSAHALLEKLESGPAVL